MGVWGITLSVFEMRNQPLTFHLAVGERSEPRGVLQPADQELGL